MGSVSTFFDSPEDEVRWFIIDVVTVKGGNCIVPKDSAAVEEDADACPDWT